MISSWIVLSWFLLRVTVHTYLVQACDTFGHLTVGTAVDYSLGLNHANNL